MPLEEGVIGLLIGGFTVVVGIAIMLTMFLWVRNKHKSSGYIWILLHLIFMSVAVYFALRAFSFDYNHPMASEENSLQLVISGLIWLGSMICFVNALFQFSRK